MRHLGARQLHFHLGPGSLSFLRVHRPDKYDAQRRDLSTVNRSGEHLLGLIDGVLDMAKIESGKLTRDVQSFDLVDLFDDLESMFLTRCHEKGLGLRLSQVPGLPRHLRGDVGKLRQILINLLGNAVKFTDQGTVSMRVSRDPQSPLTLRFAVQDSGVGIDEDEKGLLFQLFAQTSGGRARGGTGLGLAISSEYAQHMGGRIDLVSVPGEGSTFNLTCPLEPAVASEVVARASRRALGLVPAAGHPLVLVVEDQDTNRLILVRLLTTLGFRVGEATNGRDALDACDRDTPDLILMDIRMPVMDGVEATTQLRARDGLRGVPVIAVTAGVLDVASGVDAIVYKPYHEELLIDRIGSVTGLELVYETQDDSEPSAPSADAIAAMPEQLREALRHAVEDGSFTRARRVIAGLAQSEPALAEGLGAMVQRMELERLEDLLTGREGTA